MYALARIVHTAVRKWEERHYETRMADRQFDGGEWSSGAWLDLHDEYCGEVLQRVADWGNVSVQELDNQWAQYMHATEQMVYDGLLPEHLLYA